MEHLRPIPLWVELPLYVAVVVAIGALSDLADRKRKGAASPSARKGWLLLKIACLLALGISVASFLLAPVLW